MARQKNIVKTVQITISTTQPISTSLHQLVKTGLFGKNPAEAAERLIAKEIQALRNEGLFLNNKNNLEEQKFLWESPNRRS